MILNHNNVQFGLLFQYNVEYQQICLLVETFDTLLVIQPFISSSVSNILNFLLSICKLVSPLTHIIIQFTKPPKVLFICLRIIERLKGIGEG